MTIDPVKKTPPVRIGNRDVGPGFPCLIVAEISANHNGSLERAKAIIKAAQEAGADAVKLQTYTADTITLDCDNDYFKIKTGPWAGQTLYELYKSAYTPWEWHQPLKEYAELLGLECFSSPFDPTAVEFLENMQVKAYKIASFELVDIPLIRQVARTGKPVIMSVGMATEEEIAEAVDTVRAEGNDQIVLLQCTSAYPAPAEDARLKTIKTLSEKFNVVAGLSDHTLTNEICTLAVAAGACIIEKHLTLSRKDGGPDSGFSLEPQEFAEMVKSVRRTESVLGNGAIGTSKSDYESRKFRRSLFVVEDVKKGEPFTSSNVRSIRPGSGLAPSMLEAVLGKHATRDIQKGTPLESGCFA